MKAFVSYAVLFLGVVCAAAAMAQGKPKSIDQVKAYAAAHESKVEVTKRNGYWWVEVDGLDPHGTGKTIAQAAEDFMRCADIMAHEPADPAHTSAQCPSDEGYI